METESWIEGKEWAVGMTQTQFEQEFLRRNPRADSVPNVKTWILKPWPKYSGIDRLDFADLEDGDRPAKPEVRAADLTKHCRGCGKTFEAVTIKGRLRENRLAWMNHEKHCKSIMNKKL